VAQNQMDNYLYTITPPRRNAGSDILTKKQSDRPQDRARFLDRMADLELSHARHNAAERLSRAAAELREVAV
jgi:hypothetical protein